MLSIEFERFLKFVENSFKGILEMTDSVNFEILFSEAVASLLGRFLKIIYQCIHDFHNSEKNECIFVQGVFLVTYICNFNV